MPVGPSAVTGIEQEVQAGGYRQDLIDLDLATALTVEEVIGRMLPLMEPSDGYAVVVPSQSTNGTIRTVGISGEQSEIGALPILDIDVSEDSVAPGLMHIRIRRETDRAPDTLGAGVIASSVFEQLTTELGLAAQMGWAVSDYTYWRQALLSNTSDPADRIGFGAVLTGTYEQNVALLGATVPQLGPPDEQTDVLTWFALPGGDAWYLLHYDDGTVLGSYDR